MSGDAFERKLGPIYDAIDARNYKNALKHTDAALKKYTGSQLLRSLRAYALDRCGRRTEALHTLDSIVKEGPESERVLHTMTFTYKSAGIPEQSTAAYVAAVDRHPNDVAILVGLFAAYSRELKYVKQQQIALKLGKLDPTKSDKYAWWAVCCVALQARAAMKTKENEGEGAAAAQQLMKLANTMSSRQLQRAGGLPPSYETLLLRADILMGDGQGTAAAAEVQATSAMKGILAGDRKQLHAAALMRAGKLEAAAAVYRDLCITDPTDWGCWHLYLDCVLPGSSAADRRSPTVGRFPVGIVGGLAEAWDEMEEYKAKETATTVAMDGGALQEVQSTLAAMNKSTEGSSPLENNNNNNNKGLPRGIVLAEVEFALRQQRLGLENTGSGDSVGVLAHAIADALPTLCSTFGCKTDLRIYLAEVKGIQDREWLATKITLACEVGAADALGADGVLEGKPLGNSASRIKALQCRVNAHSLLQELGLPQIDTLSAAITHAGTLVKLYSSHLHLSQNLDSKERAYGDELISLAVATLVEAARREEASSHNSPASREAGASLPLMLALLILEAAQVNRTVSSPLRLAACAIHGLIGAARRSASHFAALDIKSILHDSMTGHWAFPFLIGAGASQEALRPWFSGLTNLHVDQVLEAKDSLFTAFEQGTYSKVPEFVDFLQRMERSHTRAQGRVEEVVSTLRSAAGSATALRRAAAEGAAACQSMTRLLLPTCGAKEKEKGSIAFNEDLSSRPGWLPPPETDARMSVSAWWESCARHTKSTHKGLPHRSSYTDCWWTMEGTAESSVVEAARWRDAQIQGLRQRISLPAFLAGMLNESPLPRDELERLQELWTHVFPVVSRMSTPADTESTTSATELPAAACRALFSAGLALHAACAGVTCDDGQASTADADADASIKIAEAAASVHVACGRALELLQQHSPSSVLPPCFNQGFSLAAALLTEETAWSAACLVSWKKMAKGRPTLSAAIADFAGKLSQDLTSLHATLSTAVIGMGGQSSSEIATRVISQLTSELECGEYFWDFETSLIPEEVVQEVIEDQKAGAERLCVSAGRSLELLKPWCK